MDSIISQGIVHTDFLIWNYSAIIWGIIMEINRIIKELRTSRNLTQVDVADQLNCNRQKIADWERGKSTPSADDIVSLTRIFEVSADYLLGITQAATNDKSIQAVCEYTGLSNKAVEVITNNSTIREILNFFLNSDGRISLNNAYKNAPFTRFCSSLISYKKALNESISFYSEQLSKEIEPTKRSIDEMENILNDESACFDRVNAAEYQIQKAALKLSEIYCEEQIKSNEEHKERFSEIGFFYSQVLEALKDGKDQETE